MQLYDAFISYSHQADKLTAPRLQKGLESFSRTWLGRRRLRVFRDETDLSAAPSLWGLIETALDSSRFFILLASPEAARSKWVDREAKRWLATKTPGTILLVVTEGACVWDDERKDFDRERSTAIPPALFGAYPDEPLYLEIRDIDLAQPKRAGTRAWMASLAGPILGRTKDELLSLELQRVRRQLALVSVAAVTMLALAGAFLWQRQAALSQRDAARAAERVADEQRKIANAETTRAEEQQRVAESQRNIAEAQRKRAESELAAARSTLALQQRRSGEALREAIDSWKTDPNWIAEKALYDFARTGLEAALDTGSDVGSAEISPDGKRVATAATGLKIWATDGRALFAAHENTGVLGGWVDFDRGGGDAVAFTNGAFAPVELYRVPQSQRTELAEKADWVWFAADRAHIYPGLRGEYGEAKGELLSRLDLRGRSLNRYPLDGDLTSVAASADDSMVAAGTSHGGLILWAADGKLLRRFETIDPVRSVEFFVGGSRLAAVTEKGTLATFGVRDGSRRVLAEKGVGAAALSPDGRRIAAWLDDGIKLMPLDGGDAQTFDSSPPAPSQGEKRNLDFRQAGPSGGGALRFVNGGGYLAASTGIETQIWDVEAGHLVRTAAGALLDASADRNLVVTAGQDSALIWTVDDALRSEIRPATRISAGAVAVDGAVATGSFDGKARVWNDDGALATTVDHGAPITLVRFAPDGRALMTVGRNNRVRVWSRDGSLLRELSQSGVVTDATFLADGRSVLTASVDGTAALWSPDGVRTATLDHGGAEIYCVALSPDGRVAATGAADGVLRAWSSSNGALLWQAKTDGNVTEIAYSADSRRLVAATTGKMVSIFEAATGRRIKDLPHSERVRQIAVGNGVVATSADDRQVRAWDLDGGLIETLPQAEQTTSLAVSRDDMRIVTGSEDGAIRIWDLHGGDLLDLSEDSTLEKAVFSADGSEIVSFSKRRARRWRFGSPEAIVARYQDRLAEPRPTASNGPPAIPDGQTAGGAEPSPAR